MSAYRRFNLFKYLAGLVVIVSLFYNQWHSSHMLQQWDIWNLKQFSFDLNFCNETRKQELPPSWMPHLVHIIPLALKLTSGNVSGFPTIPVVVWPLIEFGLSNSEGRHLAMNGIQESPYLHMSKEIYNLDPHVVWIGDIGITAALTIEPLEWCERFHRHVVVAQNKRAKRALPLQWPIFIVDYRDTARLSRCEPVERAVGVKFVHYSKRSIVNGRFFSNETMWVEPGTLIGNNVQFLHTPYFIRTDIVDTINKVLSKRGIELKDLIEKVDRVVDVSHFWPLGPAFGRSSKLRTVVSNFLENLKKTSKWNIVVGLAGKGGEFGHTGVNENYVNALLGTKIVVVTQRDYWEDHYRLPEALASGAMVLTDRMLSKPLNIENGTALVEFTSLADLQDKIGYYLEHEEERLAIARLGWSVAMTHHRSWHRIEEIIFGQPITGCKKTVDCPFIVHTSDGCC